MNSEEQVAENPRGPEATGGCEVGRGRDWVGSAGKMGLGRLDRSATTQGSTESQLPGLEEF